MNECKRLIFWPKMLAYIVNAVKIRGGSPNIMSENPYRAMLVDFTISNSSLIDDFIDEEAMPLMEWAAQQAERVGDLIDSDESYEEVSGIFLRWLRIVFSLILRRAVDDTEWADKMFARLEEYAPILQTSVPTAEQRQTLLDNKDADVAGYAALLLPMVEPNQKPNLLEATRDALGKLGDLFGGDLRDVSRADTSGTPIDAHIVPGPPGDPVANYQSPTSADDQIQSDPPSDDKTTFE